MTREDVRAILGETATDEAIDAILNAHSKDIGGFKGQLDRLKATNGELAAANAEYERAKAENMSEQEKWQAALDKANSVQADYAKRVARLSAGQVLAGAGVADESANALLDAFDFSDETQGKTVAEAIAALLKSTVATTEETVRKEILAGTPRPPAGDDPDALPKTFAEFSKLPDSKQIELKRQDPSILSKLA